MIGKSILGIGVFMVALLPTGCRHDELVYPSESENTGAVGGSGGMYVLNEGNMGSNKCTIDFYDFATGEYHRNIYPERNPEQVMELGDVGNDIAVYGSKLYITVNCSHKVEVLDAATARRIKQIDIPNCRYLAFNEGNAYVSSYIGPVGVDPNSPLGAVVRIDTVSLTVTGEATVGYQPEEMAVAGNTLFVANSGGYRAPYYDNTITAISLSDFSPSYTIETEINLHRLKADRNGALWANSRGNLKDIPSSLIKFTKGTDGKYKVNRVFQIPCDNFTFRGDSLLYVSSSNGKNTYGAINIIDGRSLGSFISPELEKKILKPYALEVDPFSGNLFLTDAKNYVSSGTVYCIDRQGNALWEARTGDIPAAIAFTRNAVSTPVSPEPETPQPQGAYISKVFDYCPAPGQFINLMPLYEDGDSYEDILKKCEESICGLAEQTVSLGGFGGYIVFGFDHMVPNVEGEADFRIWGNTIWQNEEIRGGSAEPGIVMVSYDANGNGLPDDEWYELAGSEYYSNGTVHNYTISYEFGNPIKWNDSLGVIGEMTLNPFHSQPYWPQWTEARKLTFTGTRLAPNAVDVSGNGTNFILYSYGFGYADNFPNSYAAENSFDISWAVDSNGNPVKLPGIHFVKVITGLNQQCGSLGETSTEICKAADLHFPTH